jgi:hypothetical protein
MEQLKTLVETYIVFPVAILLFLLTVRLIFSDLVRCHRLMARMYSGNRRETFWSILGALMGLVLRDLFRLRLFETRMLRRVRMRVEHEIFRPRPVFVWPLPDDHPDYDSEGLRARDGSDGRKRAKKRHARRLAEWHKAMGRIYGKGEQQLIRVEAPAEVNARFAEIKHYFDTLRSLDLEGEDEENGDARKFVCAMVVATGFVAPIHLLTGLLVQFNQKWKTILTAFDRDANDSGGPRQDGGSADLRQIQMFIYNCWLLWGPSIPVCSCDRWHAPNVAIQYGFGDENNSIELVGQREAVAKDLAALFAQARAELAAAGKHHTPMALPATVRGRLQLSGSLKEPNKTGSPLPVAARDSWGGEQDERPVLFVSESEEGDAVKGDITVKQRSLGRIAADTRALKSRYYSAYLWVAFVMLRHEGRHWVPLSESEPWKDLIPFFEHGNLADPETCFFSKKQLVVKALNGIASIMRARPHGAVPLRFAYACAVDDSGCGRPLAFPDWAGGETIRESLQQALAEKAAAGGEEGALFARLAADKTVLFDHYTAADGDHPYSACQLPVYIDRHYRSMEEAD